MHRRLTTIKLLHTAVWAAFAGCIVAIPVLTLQGHFRLAAVFALIVLGEIIDDLEAALEQFRLIEADLT